MKTLRILATLGAIMVANDPLLAQEKAKGPADGYDIHIVATDRHEVLP